MLNQVKRSCDHSLEQFDPRKLGHAVILCCTIHNLRGNDDQCPFDLVVHLRFYQTRDCRFPIIASICQPIGSKQGKIIIVLVVSHPLFLTFLLLSFAVSLDDTKRKGGGLKSLFLWCSCIYGRWELRRVLPLQILGKTGLIYIYWNCLTKEKKDQSFTFTLLVPPKLI